MPSLAVADSANKLMTISDMKQSVADFGLIHKLRETMILELCSVTDHPSLRMCCMSEAALPVSSVPIMYSYQKSDGGVFMLWALVFFGITSQLKRSLFSEVSRPLNP